LLSDIRTIVESIKREYKGKTMKIVFLSGKGGTGKTTFATNFYYYLHSEGKKVFLIDTDVEAPNSHIFFAGKEEFKKGIFLKEAQIEQEKCNLCGECVKACQFNALAQVGKSILVFGHLCHGCGLCELVCEKKAISYFKKPLGKLWSKHGEKGEIIWGTLNIGESLAPPIIEELISIGEEKSKDNIVIIDAPPGATCPAVAASEKADYAVVVAESTPFGFHDFKNVVVLLEKLHKPIGVIINKVGLGDDRVEDYCLQKGYPVLLKMAFDKKQSRVYGDGKLVLEALPEKREYFALLWKNLKNKLKGQ
jgi:MinD superfamily P-loop ATPase